MKIKLYREFGSRNSLPVFNAFEQGVLNSGDEIVNTYDEADAVVIWSILFAGAMRGNKEIYEQARKDRKTIVVLEIGSLCRNRSWRVGLGGINRDAIFGHEIEVSENRKDKFPDMMKPWKTGGEFVTIATQRPDSLQWYGLPSMEEWIDSRIRIVKDQTDMPIVIRPHPRDKLTNFHEIFKRFDNIYYDTPQPTGYHDHMNFSEILDRSAVVINHSTGPSIEAVLSGVPICTSPSSLAWDMSSDLEDINNLKTPDRTKWFDMLTHTEWFVDEIAEGTPWKRLKNFL